MTLVLLFSSWLLPLCLFITHLHSACDAFAGVFTRILRSLTSALGGPGRRCLLLRYVAFCPGACG